jgi:hypothetical protein
MSGEVEGGENIHCECRAALEVLKSCVERVSAVLEEDVGVCHWQWREEEGGQGSGWGDAVRKQYLLYIFLHCLPYQRDLDNNPKWPISHVATTLHPPGGCAFSPRGPRWPDLRKILHPADRLFEDQISSRGFWAIALYFCVRVFALKAPISKLSLIPKAIDTVNHVRLRLSIVMIFIVILHCTGRLHLARHVFHLRTQISA